MYDKQTKLLTPEADGNVNMMRNTILEWQKYRPNDKFYILLPSEVNNKLGAILPDDTLNCYPLFYDNYVVSARINRFNFPMNEFTFTLKSFLKNNKIDLIINDVIELTGNFKQMFKIEFNSTPKIISNIRHLDDNINYSYMYRVIDGIAQSNLITILSESMKNKLYEQVEDLTNYNLAQDLMEKVEVFEPSISETEIESYTKAAKILHEDKVIITFPGRLAKGEEGRTNWDKFMFAIRILSQKRNDFEVYFTDPNNAFDFSDEKPNNIHTIPKDRHIFLNLLNGTDIVVSLMDIEGFGGISVREALLFNCRPVIPYVHEYKKMVEDKTYPGFVKKPITVNNLVRCLDWAISQGHKPKSPFYSYAGKQFTVEEQFLKLLPKLEEILND
jgi:hypothetical protein